MPRAGATPSTPVTIEYALDRGDVEFAAAVDVAARVREDPQATKRTLRPVEVDAMIYPEL